MNMSKSLHSFMPFLFHCKSFNHKAEIYGETKPVTDIQGNVLHMDHHCFPALLFLCLEAMYIAKVNGAALRMLQWGWSCMGLLSQGGDAGSGWGVRKRKTVSYREGGGQECSRWQK